MYVMLLARGLAPSGCLSGGAAKNQGVRASGAMAVTVITRTPANGFDDVALPFRVVRQPGLRTLWRLLGEADVVHLAGPALVPLALGLLLRRPVVIEHHGYQAICPNGLLLYEPTKSACPGHFMARRYSRCLRCNALTVGWSRSLLRLLLTFPRRWLSKRVSVNVPVSRHVLERLQVPRARVIYHGVPDPVAAQGLDAPCSPPIDQPVSFAYVGRLVSEKGLPLLLEGARRLKDKGYAFRIKFIGDGPERQRLEAITDALALREEVIFTGFLQGVALQEAVADVTGVVMPSVWEETAGLAAMEQMMRGRLVVAADIGGLGEVVGDAGLKFPAGEVNGLADRLAQVLDEPEVVTEVGRKARQRALALFGMERMVADHLAVYERLVARSEP